MHRDMAQSLMARGDVSSRDIETLMIELHPHPHRLKQHITIRVSKRQNNRAPVLQDIELSTTSTLRRRVKEQHTTWTTSMWMERYMMLRELTPEEAENMIDIKRS